MSAEARARAASDPSVEGPTMYPATLRLYFTLRRTALPHRAARKPSIDDSRVDRTQSLRAVRRRAAREARFCEREGREWRERGPIEVAGLHELVEEIEIDRADVHLHDDAIGCLR